MKHSLTVFLLLILPLVAESQKIGKFYYNKHWELSNRDSATYVRMCVFDTVNNFFVGLVRDMYLSGKPQMTGAYQGLLKEGQFTTFYENGAIESVGTFIQGRRTGVWKFNYPDGKAKMEIDFSSVRPKVLFLN